MSPKNHWTITRTAPLCRNAKARKILGVRSYRAVENLFKNTFYIHEFMTHKMIIDSTHSAKPFSVRVVSGNKLCFRICLETWGWAPHGAKYSRQCVRSLRRCVRCDWNAWASRSMRETWQFWQWDITTSIGPDPYLLTSEQWRTEVIMLLLLSICSQQLSR